MERLFLLLHPAFHAGLLLFNPPVGGLGKIMHVSLLYGFTRPSPKDLNMNSPECNSGALKIENKRNPPTGGLN